MSRHAQSREGMVWGVVLLTAIAVLGFGTVHAPMRALVALGVAVLVAMRVRTPTTMPPEVAVPGMVGLGLVLAGLAFLLPVDASLRMVLQPELAPPLLQGLERLDQNSFPLALEPRAVLATVAGMASLLAMAMLTAVLARTRTRRLQLASGIVGVCSVAALLGVLHAALGLEQIYGVSGVPSTPVREGFFAPFVNPNHAGLLCVIGVATALGIGRRSDPAQTAALVAGGLLCVAGVVMSGSRGAVLAGGVAIWTFVMVAAPRAVAATSGGLALAAAGVVGLIGPGRVVGWWTRVWMPGALGPKVDSGRGEIWAVAGELVQGAPLVGVGPGGFAAAWRMVESGPQFSDAIHAHNDALQVLAEQGIMLGGAWICLALVPMGVLIRHLRALRHGRRRRLLAGFAAAYAAFLTGTLVSFPAHIGALALVASVVAGSMVGAGSADSRPCSDRADGAARMGLVGLAVIGLGAVWVLGDSGDDGATTESLAVLDAQLSERPTWSRGWLQRAELHVQQGDLEAAYRDLEVASAVWPTSPWPHVARARLLRRVGELRASRTAWRQALSQNFPNNDPGVYWVGVAIADEADPMSALVEVVPNRADRLRDAGTVARQAGDRLTAGMFFQRAHALDPGLGLPLVRQQMEDGDLDRARQTFSEVPEEARLSCGGLVLDTELSVLLGGVQEALGAGRAALRVCGEANRPAWIAFVRARVAAGELEATEHLEKIVAELPGRHSLRRELVAAYRSAGRHKKMVAHLERLERVGVATESERDALDRLRRGLLPDP